MRPFRPSIPALVLGSLLAVATAPRADGGPRGYLKKDDAWFAGAEGRRVVDNVLSHQSDHGGWPKNIDTTKERFTGSRRDLKPTFDNGATTDELRLLACAFRATGEARCREAVVKGIDCILKAQYPTGGWPQRYPPGSGYHRRITFNDNAMVRLMEFLKEVSRDDRFSFLDDGRRKAAREAFDRGVRCILKCQIRIDGRLTAWCAQHDEQDCRPRPARSYELASLSGSESVGIVRLLMRIERPDPEVVRAVEGAVAWFETSRLAGIRVERRADAKAPGGRDRVVVKDPAAPPLWARFYDLETNRPFFCDRDGVPKKTLAEIGHERRNGYAWYGTWPRRLLEQECPAWRRRLSR
jgi:pectate lyase